MRIQQGMLNTRHRYQPTQFLSSTVQLLKGEMSYRRERTALSRIAAPAATCRSTTQFTIRHAGRLAKINLHPTPSHATDASPYRLIPPVCSCM